MQGPMIAEICGMQPEAMLFSKKIFPIAEVTDEPFLNARAGRVIQADHRHAEFARGLNHIGDLLRVGAADAAGEDRAVLGVNVNRPAVDFAEAGNDAVGRQFLLRHAEVDALSFRQHELFDKGARVEQFVDALARGKFAFGVLLGGRLGIGVQRDLLQLDEPLFKIFSEFAP